MENKEPMAVLFAPGVLEKMEAEMSPEELQDFMDMMQSKIADGSLFEDSSNLDLDSLRLEDPELYHELIQQLDNAAEVVKPTLN